MVALDTVTWDYFNVIEGEEEVDETKLSEISSEIYVFFRIGETLNKLKLGLIHQIYTFAT